jgi:type IV pilus assembly protein PilB
LRQDPDVVMVGEIRDNETADIAINAALTGHLMLSTLHTNEAAGAIPRLIAMGAKPFLLAPALNAIIAQRLVRRIHDACKEEIELTEEQKELIKNILADLPKASGETPPAPEQWKLYQGKGCEACNHTGYQGRIGLYEIIVMTEEIKAALSETISEYQMKELAKTQGMITMRQDGILKVLDGLTTLKEVDRTTMK